LSVKKSGDNDYKGNPWSQLEYSKLDKRWVMPQFYHKFTKILQNSVSTTIAHFIVLDTSSMIESYRLNTSQLNQTVLSTQNATLQYSWISKTLSSLPSRDWKFIIGHHPIYSSIVEGKEQYPELINNLLPIIKDKSHAYFSGHQHSMSILEDPSKVNPISHFISGAGGVNINEPIHHNFTKFSLTSHGFMFVEIFSKSFQVSIVNAETGQVEKIFQKQK
jgi:tartrate-resistant acid phosphatase type 5